MSLNSITVYGGDDYEKPEKVKFIMDFKIVLILRELFSTDMMVLIRSIAILEFSTL